MKKSLLFVFSIFTALYGTAQNVYIPDASFKAYLLGNTAINTNSDNEIQVNEAQAFTGSITCQSLGIHDLTGIEAFVNATQLSVYNGAMDAAQNSIIGTVDLSNNTQLEFVRLDYNPYLESVTLPSATPLYTLFLNYTGITTLDISGCTSINTLDCQGTKLYNLNAANSNNSNFYYLNVTTNPYLTCIQVDDAAYCNANWTGTNFQKPGGANYTEDCGYNYSNALIAHYKFFSKDAVFADSASNHTLSAEQLSNVNVAFGLNDTAAVFNGDNRYYVTNNEADFRTTSLTYAAWINASDLSNSGDYYTICGIRYGSNNNSTHLSVYDNKLRVLLKQNSAAVSGTTLINPNTWYHVALTFNASTNMIKTYVNGVLDISYLSNNSPIAYDGTNVFSIGATPGGTDAFYGKIDDVFAYNYALSDAEILTMYNEGLSTSGVSEFGLNDLINIYPNPTSTSLKVELNQITSIHVVDLSGKLMTEMIGSSNYNLDVSSYDQGVYFIRTAEGETVKFIKE